MDYEDDALENFGSMNNDLADAFLHSPMVSTLVKEEDGDYDISQLSMIMKNVLLF